MQTLFVVKVSYFGLRQFTLNPTTREGVRKAEEGAPEEAEEWDRNNDDASGDDDKEAEGHRNQAPSSRDDIGDDASDGEGLDRGPTDGHEGVVACEICQGEGDPEQAK